METGTFKVKAGLAQKLKGGVIMDVVTPEHAKIAEEAGACAVMALERVPADIRAAGGVARLPFIRFFGERPYGIASPGQVIQVPMRREKEMPYAVTDTKPLPGQWAVLVNKERRCFILPNQHLIYAIGGVLNWFRSQFRVLVMQL